MKTREDLRREFNNTLGDGIEKIRWIQDHGSFEMNEAICDLLNVYLEGVSIEDILNGNCDYDSLKSRFNKRIEDENRGMICN